MAVWRNRPRPGDRCRDIGGAGARGSLDSESGAVYAVPCPLTEMVEERLFEGGSRSFT